MKAVRNLHREAKAPGCRPCAARRAALAAARDEVIAMAWEWRNSGGVQESRDALVKLARAVAKLDKLEVGKC